MCPAQGPKGLIVEDVEVWDARLLLHCFVPLETVVLGLFEHFCVQLKELYNLCRMSFVRLGASLSYM